MLFSDSGIEDERESDKKEVKDETKLDLEEDHTPVQRMNSTNTANPDEEEEEEEEKCYMCPCWPSCPGIGLLPPALPEEIGVISCVKLALSWVRAIGYLRSKENASGTDRHISSRKSGRAYQPGGKITQYCIDQSFCQPKYNSKQSIISFWTISQ